MKKNILGLDLGTNSIGWALIEHDFETKEGKISGLSTRVIPMAQDVISKFGEGQSIPQTADRTKYRGIRRLYQRDNLRRERLHRVLHILGFLPSHYEENIDFEKNLGQFKIETKINYRPSSNGNYEFIFMDSFQEMANEFRKAQPALIKNGKIRIPYDWTIYYLRKKALHDKVTKEELAWILLNFNQKRGYYQLRGKEDETDNNKNETYEVLKVARVVDSGEVIKKSGAILYDVYFENGWKYHKQITKPEDWIDKIKEFIVTSTTLKDGSIKRTFKVVDSEKDWIAIKEKTEKEIENSDKHVGEYIYETLLKNPKQKIHGKLIRTIERKYYKKELQAILKKQIDLHKELNDRALYNACIEELYAKNEAHRSNIKDRGFDYLFIEDIIFYQRPLKSKKSSISNCQYEYKIYHTRDKETGELVQRKAPLKAIPRSHPLFIEFRMWQFLRNLKIYEKQTVTDLDVTNKFLKTEEDWCDLFDFLMDRKAINQKQFIKYFTKNKVINRSDEERYRWNFPEDLSYPMNETKAQFISRLKGIPGFDLNKDLTFSFQMNLWHIIYSVRDKVQYIKALQTFAIKNDIDTVSFVESFKNHPPYPAEYASYSEKAIKKLLPLMRIGRYWNYNDILSDAIRNVEDIMKRINALPLTQSMTIENTTLSKAISNVADDAIPKQLIRSFIPFRDKNPLSGLNTYQACYAVYQRHSEVSEITRWRTPMDIDNYLTEFKQHSLRNPIVEQVVTETLRTVRDIWQHYGNGAENFFDEIHVEIGRDMKNSADKRKAINDRNKENAQTNLRIKELLRELQEEYSDQEIRPYSPSQQELLKLYEEGILQNPYSSYEKLSEEEVKKIRRNREPSKSDIRRYRLWLEQGYVSPYTGQVIPLSRLFSEDYQIEHIIPQSRFFDDSMVNKVICESEINPSPYKGNQTAAEFIKKMGDSKVQLSNGRGSIPILTFEKYEEHCKRYFKNNRKKLELLLMEDIPERFSDRQLNDTRYISKFIKGLLSNIVREEGEREATSKSLLTLPGAITAKLKQDWGLNDKWNEIITPRFQRLNEMTHSSDFGYWDSKINAFRTQVPDEIEKSGFNKKRIDHRHHALDALAIACCRREHIQYLNTLNAGKNKYDLRAKLLIRNNQGDYTKTFQLPWQHFPVEAKNALDSTIISFKQDLRVINKTTNKTWQWRADKDGNYKKVTVKQTKGDGWAIRKPLHKETVYGAVKIIRFVEKEKSLYACLNTLDQIIDQKIKKRVLELHEKFQGNTKKIRAYLKEHPIIINNEVIKKIKVVEKIETKNATAVRKPLSEIANRGHIEKITDTGIQKILNNHILNYKDEKGNEDFKNAFSTEGIEALNNNIVTLNGGKQHQPIYRVRLYEEGTKFPVSEDKNSNKSKKYVTTAKGTNLFFAVYWDADKEKRRYETIPFNEVVEHQKQRATLEVEAMKQTPLIPVNNELGQLLFTLSPNDLVYVPSDDELENPHSVDIDQLSNEQISRIYKMVSSDTYQCFFVPMNVAISIANKQEFSNKNKMERDVYGNMIKERCWKLEVNRLGNIVKIIR